MQRQLDALKHSKPEDQSTRSTESPSAGETSNASPSVNLESSSRNLFDYTDLTRETYTLGNFSLDRQTVIELYTTFSTYFHPHLPLLEPTISVALLQQTSPLLFWTIIAVVLGRQIKPTHHEVFYSLKPAYTAQLHADIFNAPLPLHIIQALLILITFPFSSERQNRDPSWLYCGVTVNAALYMGLPKAKPLQSLRSIGVVPGAIRARASTWLACFLTSTSLGLLTGVSPLINGTDELETIERFTVEYAVPREFTYQILIHQVLAKYTSVLLNESHTAVSPAVVQLVDGELESVKSKFTYFTPRMEYNLLVAKLHLYSMTVVRMQPELTSRSVLCQLGFSVSLRIVYLMKEGLAYTIDEQHTIPEEKLPLTIPKHYFRGLFMACCFLLRYFALNTLASTEEQELACNHVSLAYECFYSISVEPRDEQQRAAKLLERLSRQKPSDVERIKTRVSDRLGASIMYDAITAGHELRNDNVEAEETTPTTTAGGSEPNETVETGTGPPIQSENLVVPEYLDINMDNFDQFDFSLPSDVWGDSMMGTFNFNDTPYHNWDGMGQ